MNFTPTSIVSHSLTETQINLERKLLQQGYDKELENLGTKYDLASKTGTVLELPKGKQLFIEVYNSIVSFLHHNLELEIKKPRKSKYFEQLIQPMVLMYDKEVERSKNFPLYEMKYENPINLLSYFTAKELTRLMVKEEVVLTVLCRKIVNPYMNAYNFFGEATNEALNGMLQIFRTYIETEFCKYFETKNLTEGIVVVLKNQYHNLHVTKEEILSQLVETKTQFKPMVVLPIEHNNLLDRTGGYLEIPSPVLKNPEFAEIRQMPFTSTNKEGEMFFRSLNKMQSTEWCINTEFLDWLQECTDSRITRMFDNDIQTMQLDLNKFRRKQMSKIADCKRKSAKAKYDSTQTTNEERKNDLLIKNLELNDEVEALEEELAIRESELGKKRGWQETIADAKFYSEFEKFYHPVFCDNRGRVYTYNTSLSFQGSSLAKSLVSTYKTARIDSNGLYELQVLLGGMLNGFDKKSPEVRQKRVQELTEAFTKCYKHEDYSVMDLIDEDELLGALNIIMVLEKTRNDLSYETGIVAYIDATSSAIQIQALIQKCNKAAELTNLLPSTSEDLPDAYKAVALSCQDICTEIANQTDEEMFATLAAFYIENDQSKLTYMGINYTK